jgi:hypothetical protein
MKVTYVCDRCGAVIGEINLNEDELAQLDMDPLTVDLREDIIKSTETGGLFVYSLCDGCVETMSFHEGEWRYRKAPDLH